MAYKLFLMFDVGVLIHLDGASIAAPVKGARYSPGLGVRSLDGSGFEVIREEIKLELAGTYRQMTDWIRTFDIEAQAWKNGAWRKPTLFRPRLCLEEPDEAGGQYWWSDLLGATLELDPAGLAQRALGHQLVTLTLTRVDFWQYAGLLTALNLKFPDGVNTQQGVGYLLNHYDSDATHTNWGYVDKSTIAGSLPAKCELQIYAALAGRSMGDVYMGLGWVEDPDPAFSKFVITLQESDFTPSGGITKAGQASASCAGGGYANYTWSTSGITEICYAAIPQRLYSNELTGGRPFKPLLRLNAGLAVSDLWLKARISNGAVAPLYETDWCAYVSGSQLVELPPVYLPPEGVREGAVLYITLIALRPSSTAYSLPLDFCQLWPVDGGFRKLKGMSYVSGQGSVMDSGLMNNVWWDNGGNTSQKAAYVAVGPGLRLMPGRQNVFAICNLTGGTSWLIDDRLNVTFKAVPTKRDL